MRVNSNTSEVDSYIAPGAMGNGDLYISEQVNGTWTPARHLGNGINSTAREYCPAASPDGKYFFFTSFRGFGDRIPDAPWSYKEFRSGLDSVLNGWGNIYQVDIAALKQR